MQDQYSRTQMLLGAARLALESGKPFGQMKDEICSPGGTTIAGVRALEEGGLRAAVVPLMRQAGRGRIVNLSSVAAPVPIPFQAYYSATKAAVNAYTMALANELRPFGVTVCAVMPGDIHTGFTAARRKVSAGDAIYQGRISRSVKRMEHDEETGMDPAKAGAYIASVAMREGHHHPLYAIRFDYKFFTFLAKVLPARFLNWLIYCLYGK